MGLRVYLGEIEVGLLKIERDAVIFRFEESYLQRPMRPVLGRMFEDYELSSSAEFKGNNTSPHNFFRNYLPEGMLRKLIEQEILRADHREYRLLEKLGTDLPGNIRLINDELEQDPDEPSPIPPPPEPPGSLRFSLAGVQLKTSAELDGSDRVMVPVSGLGGRWIAKLPSKEFLYLPENEFVCLRWASRCGIQLPEHRLYDISQLSNLPKSFGSFEGRFLLIKRFDREGNRRIHQEDFAQILGIAPELKYAGEVPAAVHYGSIGRIIRFVCGESDFYEYLKRLVFMWLSGNTDAHVKNWSLIYPDGRAPRLSPAYDLVSLVAYPQMKGNHLALNLSRNKDPYGEDPRNPYELTPEDFVRVAKFAGADEEAAKDLIAAFIGAAREQWNQLKGEPETPASVREALDQYLGELPR